MPRWAIVLCKLQGHPEDSLSPEFCRQYFLRAGTGGLYDYWRDISYGRITLDGSQVFGPFDLPFTKEDVQTAVVAAGIKFGKEPPNLRTELMQMAANELAPFIDFSPFDGVIFIYNAECDTGAAGVDVRRPDGSLGDVSAMNIDPFFLEQPWLGHTTEHESGHMLGLGHAWILDPRISPKDAEYGDGWDVMGGHRLDGVAEDCRFDSPHAAVNHIRSGPGISSSNLHHLHWLDLARVVEYRSGGDMRVSLAPLNHPEVAGSMMVRIPLVASVFIRVTIELRWNDQWDRGIPRPAFLVHVQDIKDVPFLVPASPKEHDWVPRSTYATPDGALLIDFVQIDHAAKQGIIDIRRGPLLRLEPILRDGKRRWRRPGPIPRFFARVVWRVRYLIRSAILWLTRATGGRSPRTLSDSG